MCGMHEQTFTRGRARTRSRAYYDACAVLDEWERDRVPTPGQRMG